MAQGVPEDYLKMNGQLYEKLGRQKIFFECANVTCLDTGSKNKARVFIVITRST